MSINGGVLLKTTEGDFLVIDINHYDERGWYYQYSLVSLPSFKEHEWVENEDEIRKRYNVLEVLNAEIRY